MISLASWEVPRHSECGGASFLWVRRDELRVRGLLLPGMEDACLVLVLHSAGGAEPPIALCGRIAQVNECFLT